MPAYVVEIELPSGRLVRKGTIAQTEDHAVTGIRILQHTLAANGIPKCPRGTIVRVWEREPDRPIPQKVLNSPQAFELVRAFDPRRRR